MRLQASQFYVCLFIIAIIFGGAVGSSAQVPDGTVGVGFNPNSIAINSSTNTIYVANSGDSTVTVIDGATKATSTVAVGKTTYYTGGVGPSYNIAANSASNKVYVANVDDGTVTVIDGNNHNATTTINLGGPTAAQPSSIAINTQTNKIYVTDYKYLKVWVINGADNTFTSIAAGDEARSVAVNETTTRSTSPTSLMTPSPLSTAPAAPRRRPSAWAASPGKSWWTRRGTACTRPTPTTARSPCWTGRARS